MRTLCTICLFCFFAAWTQGQAQLTIEVELNKADAGGAVRVALCQGEQAYDQEKGCILVAAPAKGGVVVMTVPELAPGTYAIKAFHDVNDNGKFDFNWAGIPREPYGFSNNATGFMAAPGYEQAAFTVAKGRNTTRLKLKG